MTVRERVVEWVAPPPEALIITVVVPVVAELVAVNLIVTVQVGVHGLFVNIAEMPLGGVDVVNASDAAVPVERVAVIDDVALVAPWMTVRLPGEGEERVNSNGVPTVTSNVPLLVS